MGGKHFTQKFITPEAEELYKIIVQDLINDGAKHNLELISEDNKVIPFHSVLFVQTNSDPWPPSNEKSE